MRLVLAMTEPEREAYRLRAVRRVEETYSWDAVTECYEQLFQDLTRPSLR